METAPAAAGEEGDEAAPAPLAEVRLNDGIRRRGLSGKVARPEYFFWCAVILSFAGLLTHAQTSDTKRGAEPAVASAAQKNPYDGLRLLAKAAVVYDQKQKRTLYEYNANTPWPLASLTKVMTAVTALSLVPETTLLTVDARSLFSEGDSGLKEGEIWILRDLLKFMLVKSSNDAAEAVARTVGATAAGTDDLERGRAFFINRMNELARSLGLGQTIFKNESGLDIGTTDTGGVSTAREAVAFFDNALRRFGSIFKPTKWSEVVLEDDGGATHSAANTNRNTDRFPLLLASKTGYTDIAGGNLLIAFDAGFNHPIIIAVLGSTVDGRFTDTEKLVWATLEFLSRSSGGNG